MFIYLCPILDSKLLEAKAIYFSHLYLHHLMQCLSLSSCSGIDCVRYAKINAPFDPPTSALKDPFLSFPIGFSLVYSPYISS